VSITFRPAVRESVGLVIGMAGPSGGGKTFSAMRLAAGLAGPKRVAVIDTEARRALHYADRFQFDHADLQAPFTPGAYSEAIAAADAAGYPVIVVDSCSHEWAGDGGMLDMQEEEFQRLGARDTVKMTSWIKPKMGHKKMVQRLLQCRAHLILCFRAEQKIDMVRGANGKLEVVPKTIASGFSDWIPVAEKNLLYELTASFLLTPDAPGVPKPIKLQEQHRPLFPTSEPIGERAGQALAAWAAGGAQRAPAPAAPGDPRRESHADTTDPREADERAALLAKITELGKGMGAPRKAALWSRFVGAGVEADAASIDALRNLRDELATAKGAA
jgi:hypothetical protein